MDIGSTLIDDLGEHHEFAVQAARFLIVLGLLVDVEDGPLRVELDRKTCWRHVYLGERQARARGGEDIPPPIATADPDARIADVRPVTGHLKRQRYGEGRALTKWIYVQGYSARRWCAPRWLVSRRDGDPAAGSSLP